LLRRGALHALPMGYLIAGRIGTGKTFLVTCWAGELGIPCVVFKNFRDRWVGATESNLERIFGVLRALGQVVVFVDEATGRLAAWRQRHRWRPSGPGVPMLTKNVGHQPRPDHWSRHLRPTCSRWISSARRPTSTFRCPAETAAGRALLAAVVRKLAPVAGQTRSPGGPHLGSNEESSQRSGRNWRKAAPGAVEDPAKVVREVRPAHARLDMDLVAVKECTDARFLPARFRDLTPDEVEGRIEELRRFV
jgi:hypothetical protein